MEKSGIRTPALPRALPALMLLFALSASAASDKVLITATGASTIAPLMSEIGKRFELANPHVRIDVQAGGTSRGVADVRQGSARIGMVSRALHADEADLQAALIAKDGVAMVAHKSNPVKKLTREQVIAIYTGKVKNWKEVGGADQPITVISKAEGRSTLEVFAQYFGLNSRAIKAHIIIGDNQQEIRTVSTNKGAIGYVSIGSAEYEARHGAPLKMLQLDQFVPSTASVAAGTYPMARDLNLVYRTPLNKDETALLRFATSPAANKIIEAQYFIPVNGMAVAGGAK
jgi:phosphate transport system substrate-binding protein